jgi:hypothetical protein
VGLKELAGLHRLQGLWLGRTQVSDAGLVHLRGLTNLTTLDLTQTQVTFSGIAALQKVLPACQFLKPVVRKSHRVLQSLTIAFAFTTVTKPEASATARRVDCFTPLKLF